MAAMQTPRGVMVVGEQFDIHRERRTFHIRMDGARGRGVFALSKGEVKRLISQLQVAIEEGKDES